MKESIFIFFLILSPVEQGKTGFALTEMQNIFRWKPSL